MQDYKLFIGGEWTDSSTDETFYDISSRADIGREERRTGSSDDAGDGQSAPRDQRRCPGSH